MILEKNIAIKTVNDFLNIKSRMCHASTQSLLWRSIYLVPVVGGKLACKGASAYIIKRLPI